MVRRVQEFYILIVPQVFRADTRLAIFLRQPDFLEAPVLQIVDDLQAAAQPDIAVGFDDREKEADRTTVLKIITFIPVPR